MSALDHGDVFPFANVCEHLSGFVGSAVLNRPPNEKPFILFPVGYPAPEAEVPDLRRKSLEEVAVWLE